MGINDQWSTSDHDVTIVSIREIMTYLLTSIDRSEDHLVTHHHIVTIGAQLKH